VEWTQLVLSSDCTTGRVPDESLSFWTAILGSWFLIDEYSGKMGWPTHLRHIEGLVLPAVDVFEVDALVPPNDTTVALNQ